MRAIARIRARVAGSPVRPPAARRWALTAAALLVAAAGLAVRSLVFPASDVPGPTDAVVVLAGAPEVRLPVAVRLARAESGVLVVSAAGGEVNVPAHTLCDEPPRDVVVHCFEPAPPQNTRTEAQAIAELVDEQGWTRVTVVTSSYHMARAELLVERCTDADVRLVEARPTISGPQWARYVVAEIGGLGAAVLSRSC